MIPKNLIIHHSATNRDKTTFASINNGHKRRWNWRSALGYYIGYQYFITSNGRVKQGRKDTENGAHTKGWNNNSIGICLTGNFMFDRMTSQQTLSLKVLLDRLKEEWKIPNQNIFGHREKGMTLCPGNKLMGWIKKYRKKPPQEEFPETGRQEIISQIKKLLIKLK